MRSKTIQIPHMIGNITWQYVSTSKCFTITTPVPVGMKGLRICSKLKFSIYSNNSERAFPTDKNFVQIISLQNCFIFRYDLNPFISTR